jgi:HAD superfamily hydrolase (TIGR01509 family)
MIRLVLFDVDDTLLPTTETFWAAVQEVLHARYGAGADEAVQQVLRLVSYFGTTEYRGFFLGLCAERGLSGAAREAEHAALCAAYKSAYADRVVARPGARECLEALRAQGRSLGVVSNGRSAFQRMKLERSGLADLLDGPILVSGDFPPSYAKPSPLLFEHALRQTGLRPNECVFIGDRTEDVIGGRLAGLWVVRYETLLHPPGPAALRSAQPHATVSDPAEIAAVVGRLGHPA